jgi:hypothetical protein
MYTPIHALRQSADADARQARGRWDTPEGQATLERVMELIDSGAGEDFLQADFEAGRLPALTDMWDLKGIYVGNQEWTFPPEDTFEAIDFSFGKFHKVSFTNALFQSTFKFALFKECRFVNCSFQFTYFYGTEFDDVEFEGCDFLEFNDLVNCQLTRTRFNSSYYAANLFTDCSFDRACELAPSTPKPVNVSSLGVGSGTGFLVELYRSVKEAYNAGGAPERSRDYYYKQMEAARLHQTPGKWDRTLAFAFKWIAGYGVRPLRVLATIAALYVLAAAIFKTAFDLPTSLLLAAGALFTFGARAEQLASVPWPYSVVYGLTSFGGIALTALFVTVLAAVFLRER